MKRSMLVALIAVMGIYLVSLLGGVSNDGSESSNSEMFYVEQFD